MSGGGDEVDAAKPGMKKKLSVRANIMTPVKPMLVRREEDRGKDGERVGSGEGKGEGRRGRGIIFHLFGGSMQLFHHPQTSNI